ncbi:MAG: signal peptidase [Haloarculaceae archaeon]|jgi:signal peptidase
MSVPGDERDPDDPSEDAVGTEVDSETDESTADPNQSPDAVSPIDTRASAGSHQESRPAREEWRRDERRDGPPSRQPEGNENRGGWQLFLYDVVSSILAVLVVGAYLFAVSGVWPPLVAVESGSMVPNMEVNDLVFVMEADRFPGEGAHEETGVVTARSGAGTDYRKFGGHGDVIVYEPNGNANTVPIIHRAMFWVNDSENWYDKANSTYVRGAGSCETDDDPETDTGLRNCPAPHAGFVTKGDANGNYDQASGLSEPVKPAWVVGSAEVRIPGLGWIRLQSQE